MSKLDNLEPRIGVACELMGLEGGPVKRSTDGIRKIQRKPFAIHANDEIAVVSTGVKKEFAKSAVEHLLESCPSIKDLIHIGFTGSLDGVKFPKGTVLLGNSAQAFDSQLKEEIDLDESMGILSGVRAKTAKILSVDGFITGNTDPQKLAELRAAGGIVDMEAYVTSQACEEHGVTPHILKLVSDEIKEGRLGIWQLIGLIGALRARKNMDPVFQETLQAIRKFRSN